MKANELMIGDFLRYKQDFPHTHLQGKIVKVCGIRGRVDVRTIDDGNFHESEHPDWLEPIPLTPEILEKNGFQYNNLPFVQGWEQFGLTLYRGGNGYRINCETNVALVIDSVHELQHALRLCQIDKEIKL